MGSRRKTDGESVRPPALSRRAILAGTSAAAFAAAKPVAAIAPNIPSATSVVVSDEGARRCANWLAIDTKIARLQTRWAKLESWLAREHNWFQLSSAEQQALPGAQELRDIDGCLDVLFEKRDALLESLPTSGSISLESVIARLAVAERLIWADEHPEAHVLIAGARRDLGALAARGSHPEPPGGRTLAIAPWRPNAAVNLKSHQDFER